MIEEKPCELRYQNHHHGVSLLDCIDPNIERAAENLPKTKLPNLALTRNEITAAELRIPIVNKRVSVSPLSLIGAATDATDYVVWQALDKAARRLVKLYRWIQLWYKRLPKGDEILINSIPRALAETDKVCSSVNIARQVRYQLRPSLIWTS